MLPASECLKDVVARMLPYWFDDIVPDLQAGHTTLVVAHGNSLRALIKHLDGISDEDIAGLDLPTGVPMLYELGDDMRPTERKAPLEPGPRRRRGGQGRGRGRQEAGRLSAGPNPPAEPPAVRRRTAGPWT